MLSRSLITRLFPVTFLVLALALAACGGDDGSNNETDTGGTGGTGGDETATEESELDRPIVFADYNWDGPLFHNRVAQYILENGYEYETEVVPGETIPLFQGQLNGEIDVSMEIWLDQMPEFQPAVEEGTIIDLGPNFEGALQGWYVPTYVIEGDEERGIEPMAPDLNHVDDLPEYKDLFEDPEEEDQGRLYDGPAGWEAERVHEVKFEAYGLGEHYNRFLPGSGAALHTSLVTAYEAGDPWLGYQWTPNWVTGLYDLTRLEEPEYSDECWDKVEAAVESGGTAEEACAWPAAEVHKSVTASFAEEAPDVTEFLDKYSTTVEQNDAALAHMAENEAGHEEAAIFFLKEYPDTWHEWVPEDVAERVEGALENEPTSE